MSPWMWAGIWWLVLFGGGFWFGILYKGRKIKPIISIIKDKNLSPADKAKKVGEIIT